MRRCRHLGRSRSGPAFPRQLPRHAAPVSRRPPPRRPHAAAERQVTAPRRNLRRFRARWPTTPSSSKRPPWPSHPLLRRSARPSSTHVRARQRRTLLPITSYTQCRRTACPLVWGLHRRRHRTRPLPTRPQHARPPHTRRRRAPRPRSLRLFTPHRQCPAPRAWITCSPRTTNRRAKTARCCPRVAYSASRQKRPPIRARISTMTRTKRRACSTRVTWAFHGAWTHRSSRLCAARWHRRLRPAHAQ